MDRDSDTEELSTQYRGGCGVDAIGNEQRLPSDIPDSAYVLENGYEKSFPENPRRSVPDNQPLTELSTAEVLDQLSALLEGYAEKLRQSENIEKLAESTGESVDMVQFDIKAIEKMSDKELLRSWLKDGETDLSEYMGQWKDAEGYAEAAAPLGRGVNINAGHNIGAVILPEVWRVLARDAVLHKMPSDDQLTLRILHEVYQENQNAVTETCRIGYWPGGSEELEKNLFSMDYVMAWGNDSTISAIREKLYPTARFIPFHFEFGVYLVGQQTQKEYDQELLQQIAKDFSWGDQLLCFSPLLMVVEESDATEGFLQDLATVLESYTENYSMGEVPQEEKMKITRAKKTAKDSGKLISDWENDTTVIQKMGIEPSDIQEFYNFRFVEAHTVEDLETTIETIGSVGNLQEFILAAAEQRENELRDKILETQAKRIVSPGGAPPTLPIPWDGKHPINELVRWVSDERTQHQD